MNFDTNLHPTKIFLNSGETSNNISSSTKNNLIFDLNQTILAPPNIDILISLESFSFTNCFYNITNYNHLLIITFDNVNFLSYVIQNNHYDIDTLISTLNTIQSSLTFSYSMTSYKVSISCITPFRICSSTFNPTIGFDENIESISLTNTITSPYFFNLTRPNYLNICLPNLNLKSISLKSKTHYNQIDSVMITSSFGDNQFYKNENSFYYIISENSISSIQVMICDEIHNHIDFNNINWFMCLNIGFQYKKEIKPADYLINLYDSSNLAIYDFLEEEIEQEKQKQKSSKKKE